MSRSSSSRSNRSFRTGSWTRRSVPAATRPRTVQVDRPRYVAASRRPSRRGVTAVGRGRARDLGTRGLCWTDGTAARSAATVPGLCPVLGCVLGLPGRPGNFPPAARRRSCTPGSRVTPVVSVEGAVPRAVAVFCRGPAAQGQPRRPEGQQRARRELDELPVG